MATAPYTEIIYDIENNGLLEPTLQIGVNYLVEYRGTLRGAPVVAMLLGMFSDVNTISSFQATNGAVIRNNEIIVTNLPPPRVLQRFNNFGENIKKIYQVPEPAPAPAILQQGGYKKRTKKVRKIRKARKARRSRRPRRHKK